MTNTLNNKASKLLPILSLKTYMVPPIKPLLSFFLYFNTINVSAYLVAIANTPDINIQNILPIPPIVIAVAIPIIFPVPNVPASIVIKDLKELIPSLLFFLSANRIYFSPFNMFFCGNFSLNV
ncbi:hypothetical protein D3C71_1727750 [compost metagenome]